MTNGRFQIFDFKTGDGAVSEMNEVYENQLRHYTVAVSKIFGIVEDEIEAEIWKIE